ncbi:hypothetical protein JXL19_11760, partial [bacterium]|nr:hypothetical protein [bacterium]
GRPGGGGERGHQHGGPVSHRHLIKIKQFQSDIKIINNSTFALFSNKFYFSIRYPVKQNNIICQFFHKVTQKVQK